MRGLLTTQSQNCYREQIQKEMLTRLSWKSRYARLYPSCSGSQQHSHAHSTQLPPLSSEPGCVCVFSSYYLINPPWLNILSVCSALQHRPASCFQDTWEPSSSSPSSPTSPTAPPLSCSSSAQCPLFRRAGALHCTPADEAGLPPHQKGSLSGFLPPSTTLCAFISLQLEVWKPRQKPNSTSLFTKIKMRHKRHQLKTIRN